MIKTTVYLPRELKRALSRTARNRGMSEAALLREAVIRIVADPAPQTPSVPLFRSNQPSIADAIDDGLDDYGTD